MKKIMTEEQQELVTTNLKMVCSFIRSRAEGTQIPPSVQDDYTSDLALQFCISAIKFDKTLGFKFSTYAYGGFNMVYRNVGNRTKAKYDRNNYCPTAVVLYFIDEFSDKFEKTNSIAKEELYHIIDNANLTTREIMIIQDYYFGKESMRTIGKKIGRSHKRVSQIIKEILGKLRRSASREKLTLEDFYIE